jgi:hypothetical protein
LRCEEVCLALPLHRHLAHVLQQDRSDGLRGAGPIKTLKVYYLFRLLIKLISAERILS